MCPRHMRITVKKNINLKLAVDVGALLRYNSPEYNGVMFTLATILEFASHKLQMSVL